MNAVRQFSTEGDYKVADISLADWAARKSTSPSTRCRA